MNGNAGSQPAPTGQPFAVSLQFGVDVRENRPTAGGLARRHPPRRACRRRSPGTTRTLGSHAFVDVLELSQRPGTDLGSSRPSQPLPVRVSPV
jgi:hypothetical protein